MTGLKDGSIDGNLTYCLGQMPHLMQRSREALALSTGSEAALREILHEMISLRDTLSHVVDKLRERWQSTVITTGSAESMSRTAKRIMLCCHARALAFGLAVGILVNCVVGILQQDDTEIRHETFQMSEEILELADFLSAYRPLGSMAITVFLSAAWVGAPDPKLKARIEMRAMEFSEDIYGSDTTFMKRDLDTLRDNFMLAWTGP